MLKPTTSLMLSFCLNACYALKHSLIATPSLALLCQGTEKITHGACTDRSDGKVVAFGFGLDFICNSALVCCYSKLDLVDDASYVFNGTDEPDLVLWNAMIPCYGSCGNWLKGIELFNRMQDRGIRPDGYTIVGLIIGLADRSLINVGEMIHTFCVKCGLDLSDHVGSVLVSMYSKFKNMESAYKARDHVNALMFFAELFMSGKRAECVLLASILASSAQLAIVGPGSEIHRYAVRHECVTEVAVSSTLVDMYSKCGFLEMGIKVFKHMPKRNIVSYNIVIASLGLYFRMFDESLREGLKPDETTFVGLLGACCHSGLVNKGWEYFRMMREEFGNQAKNEFYVLENEHYVLLGMDGKLDEAYELIRSLPEPVDSGIWGAFLSCCGNCKSYEFLVVIAAHLLENEPRNSTYSVMISNLFADDGRWKNVKRLRVKNGGKMPGISWIS